MTTDIYEKQVTFVDALSLLMNFPVTPRELYTQIVGYQWLAILLEARYTHEALMLTGCLDSELL